MKVFTAYDGSEGAPPNQARIIKLWAESWRKHGWTPRVLTKRTMRGYKPREFAYSPRLKGVFVPSNAINFGLKRRPKKWMDILGQVVLVFHANNPQQILDYPAWR